MKYAKVAIKSNNIPSNRNNDLLMHVVYFLVKVPVRVEVPVAVPKPGKYKFYEVLKFLTASPENQVRKIERVFETHACGNYVTINYNFVLYSVDFKVYKLIQHIQLTPILIQSFIAIKAKVWPL